MVNGRPAPLCGVTRIPRRPAAPHRPTDRLAERTARRPGPPTGTVTFLALDAPFERTTWEAHPVAVQRTLAQRALLVHDGVARRRGTVVTRGGDLLVAAFPGAVEALIAADELRRTLTTWAWPGGLTLPTGIALHTGEAEVRRGAYVGLDAEVATCLLDASRRAGLVVSGVTAAIVEPHLPPYLDLADLGWLTVEGLSRPVALHAVVDRPL